MFKGELDKRSGSGFTIIEGFSIECRKTKTKVIIPAKFFSANRPILKVVFLFYNPTQDNHI